MIRTVENEKLQNKGVLYGVYGWYMLFFLLLLALCSCERRELTYYEVSEITVMADWNDSSLNEEEQQYGATAIFYPRDGSEVKIFRMGDRSGEVVRLPIGVYDVVIFNRSFNDFGNISFRGANAYRTLEAYARKVETRKDDTSRTETRVIVSSPDELAVGTLEGFTVTEDMLGNYSQTTYGRATPSRTAEATSDKETFIVRLQPKKLTREVVAVLHVEGLNNIRSATCRLEGVAESVFLATGEVSPHTVIQEFTPSTSGFVPGSPFNGTLTGTFEVFGFWASGNHHLHLDALLVDGRTRYTDDYSQVEVEEKDNGGGEIFLQVEVTTEKIPDVKPEGGSGSGFDVDVDGWGDEVGTDIPIQ